MSFNDKGLNCISSTLLSAVQQWSESSRGVYIKLSETIAKGQKKPQLSEGCVCIYFLILFMHSLWNKYFMLWLRIIDEAKLGEGPVWQFVGESETLQKKSIIKYRERKQDEQNTLLSRNSVTQVLCYAIPVCTTMYLFYKQPWRQNSS